MRRIRIINPLVDKTYKTYVGADYSSGATLTVISNVSFAANDIALVGEPREEYTETKKVNSISGSTTFNLASALNFSHGKGTSVYRTIWDNVSIEGRSSSSGTFAELTQSALQWDNRNNETVYYHSDGTDSWEYRFRFYNSVTATYSEYSPTLTGSSPARNSVRYMISQVRKNTADEERKIVPDDSEIIRAFNEAQDIIYSHNPKYWFLYVDTYKGSSSISATASNDVYTLASYTTLGHLDTIRYRYTSGSLDEIYHLRRKSNVEFDSLMRDLNRSKDDHPLMYKMLPADSASSKGYFQVDPVIQNSGVGQFYPNYYEKMADLDTVDDTTQVPLPFLLENYAISYVEKIKGNEKKSAIYEAWLLDSDPNKVPKGLAMLDAMDVHQRGSTGQPKQLVRFRGQSIETRLYGERTPRSRDWERENYFTFVPFLFLFSSILWITKIV